MPGDADIQPDIGGRGPAPGMMPGHGRRGVYPAAAAEDQAVQPGGGLIAPKQAGRLVFL